MIYYILPPIIMVLALAMLVFFIGRKVNKISELGELGNQDYLKKNTTELGESITSKISHFFLRILEKMTKRFKIISLKLHNGFESWSKKIREKREARLRKREEFKKAREEANAIGDSKQDNGQKGVIGAVGDSAVLDVKLKNKFGKKTKPMVSNEVVLPETKNDERSGYENILIERIAINPRDIEAYERLGDYYVEKNNVIDARECFKQVLKLSPGNRKAKNIIRKFEIKDA